MPKVADYILVAKWRKNGSGVRPFFLHFDTRASWATFGTSYVKYYFFQDQIFLPQRGYFSDARCPLAAKFLHSFLFILYVYIIFTVCIFYLHRLFTYFLSFYLLFYYFFIIFILLFVDIILYLQNFFWFTYFSLHDFSLTYCCSHFLFIFFVHIIFVDIFVYIFV